MEKSNLLMREYSGWNRDRVNLLQLLDQRFFESAIAQSADIQTAEHMTTITPIGINKIFIIFFCFLAFGSIVSAYLFKVLDIPFLHFCLISIAAFLTSIGCYCLVLLMDSTQLKGAHTLIVDFEKRTILFPDFTIHADNIIGFVFHKGWRKKDLKGEGVQHNYVGELSVLVAGNDQSLVQHHLITCMQLRSVNKVAEVLLKLPRHPVECLRFKGSG